MPETGDVGDGRAAELAHPDIRAAAASWTVIDEAKGLLVERFGYGTDEALEHLQRLADQADAEVRSVAAALLNDIGHDSEATRTQSGELEQVFDPGRYVRSAPAPEAAPRPARPPMEVGAPPSDLDRYDADRFLEAASALAAGHDPDELARLLNRELRVFNPSTVLLTVLESDGGLRMTGVSGRAAEVVSEWVQVPVQLSLPIARMATGAQVVWLDDDMVGDQTLVWGSRAHAGVTQDADGRLFVAACVFWSDTKPPADGAVRSYLEGLVAVAGQRLRALAIMGLPTSDLRAPWLDAVLDTIPTPAAVLFPIHDQQGRVVEFSIDRCNAQATDLRGRTPEQITGRRFTEAFPGMMLSGIFDEYVRVLETGTALHRGPFAYKDVIHGVLYPAILSVRAQKIGEGLLVSWQFHDEQARLAAQLDYAERLVHLGWAEWNLVTDEISWSAQVYEIFDRDPADGPLTLAELPARVDEQDVTVIAEALANLTERCQPVSFEFRTGPSGHVRQVSVTAEPLLDEAGQLLALRCVVQDITARRQVEEALAASRRQLELHRRHLAEELQRALLPAMHPDLPGLRVGVRYQPAENSEHVGGDWYEAVPLPNGRVLIAVGDASGHGLPAAARMAQLRNALLGVAYTMADAAMILTCLNLVVFHNQEQAATATAIVAHFDPNTRSLSWARAGHPLPILVRAGHAWQLDNPTGTVLGATDGPGYGLITTQLEAGDLVLLYTDGLIERRSEATGDRLEALLLAATHCGGGDPEQDIRTLQDALDITNPEDDTCMLAMYVR